MSLFQAAVLALVQGFTEFLPISSSAHLALAPWLLGWRDQGLTFDIALHFGTLAAVLIYFFRDWVEIIAHGFGLSTGSDPELVRNRHLLWFLAVATLPVGVAGFLLEDAVETVFRDPLIIGGMLVGVGVLMAVADRMGSRVKKIGAVSLPDAIVVGLAQALAIVPGTSRSGITIIAGLFRGLERETAARFSFLLSTPAIAGASLKALLELLGQGGIPHPMRAAFATGVVMSAVTGCLVIRFFLRYLRCHTLKFFVAYRVVFGIIVIALALSLRHLTG